MSRIDTERFVLLFQLQTQATALQKFHKPSQWQGLLIASSYLLQASSQTCQIHNAAVVSIKKPQVQLLLLYLLVFATSLLPTLMMMMTLLLPLTTWNHQEVNNAWFLPHIISSFLSYNDCCLLIKNFVILLASICGTSLTFVTPRNNLRDIIVFLSCYCVTSANTNLRDTKLACE